MSLSDVAHRFDDGAAYERFMGRWTGAVGLVFLDWLAPPAGGRWLDVGCGTGLFTQLILDTCSPCVVIAVDPAPAQIELARRQPAARRAQFQVADAQALPFPDASFDVVASALAINFIADRPRALSEMRRALRTGGVVAAYVWDLAAQRSPSWPLRLALREIGAPAAQAPGTADSRIPALEGLFARAGFQTIATRVVDVSVAFPDFDAFWQAQTPSYSPVTKSIAAMPAALRGRLIEALRANLPIGANGSIEYSARANAIKARVPD